MVCASLKYLLEVISERKERKGRKERERKGKKRERKGKERERKGKERERKKYKPLTQLTGKAIC